MWRSGQITLQRLQSSISNLRKQVADVWCRERAVINSRHVDPPQFMSFYQPHFDTLYRTDEAVLCQGAAGGSRRSPACRRLIRPDVLRWQGAVIRIRTCGHWAVKAGNYDNATIGMAAVRQLHKRAHRGRLPVRRGLSRYLTAILLFARSLFFLSGHLSRRCLGVSSVQRWPPSSSLRLTK